VKNSYKVVPDALLHTINPPTPKNDYKLISGSSADSLIISWDLFEDGSSMPDFPPLRMNLSHDPLPALKFVMFSDLAVSVALICLAFLVIASPLHVSLKACTH
jgi:hypothetical protein